MRRCMLPPVTVSLTRRTQDTSKRTERQPLLLPPHSSFIPLERRRIRLFSTLHLLLSLFTFSTFLIPCSFAQPINQLQPNIQFSPPSSRSICHLLVLLLLPSLPKFSWWNNSWTFFDGRPSGRGELSYFWSTWLCNNQSFKALTLSCCYSTIGLAEKFPRPLQSCKQRWPNNLWLTIFPSQRKCVVFCRFPALMSLCDSYLFSGWQDAHVADYFWHAWWSTNKTKTYHCRQVPSLGAFF